MNNEFESKIIYIFVKLIHYINKYKYTCIIKLLYLNNHKSLKKKPLLGNGGKGGVRVKFIFLSSLAI